MNYPEGIIVKNRINLTVIKGLTDREKKQIAKGNTSKN